MRYLITVSICWIALYAIYHLFLRRETFFSINRGYLMGSLVLGALIPTYQWLPVGLFVQEEVVSSYIVPLYNLQEVAFVTATDTWSWIDTVWCLYAVGAALALARLAHGMWTIYQLRDEALREYINDVQIIRTSKAHLPFSFGRAVYISDVVDLEIDVEQLIRHEHVHISEWHTADVLVVEMLKVFFWFNPILILYKKALQQAHEYVADAMVIKDISRKSYGQLLLRQSQSGMEIALANHFFHSQIKKRIQMMYKQKSKRSAMVKYLSAIPVLALLVVCFSAYYPSNADDLEDRLYEIVTADMSEDDRIYNLLGLLTEQKAEGADMDYAMRVMSDYGVDVTPDSDRDSYSLCRYFDRTAAKIEEVRLARGIAVDTLPAKTLIMIDGEPFDGELEDLPFGTIHYTTRVRGEEASKKYDVPPNTEVIEVKLADREKQLMTGESYLSFESNTIVSVRKGQDPSVIRNEINRYPALVIGNKVVSLDRPIERSDLPDEVATYQFVGAKQAESMYGSVGRYGALVVQTRSGFLPEINVVGYGEPSGKDQYSRTSSTIDSKSPEVTYGVDALPAFPGCEEYKRRSKNFADCSQDKLLRYVYSRIKYPAAAREAGEEGTIVIRFNVNSEGRITTSEVLRSVGSNGLDGAVMDVIDQMRSEITWLPALKDGKKITATYTLPIRFKLQSEPDTGGPVEGKPAVYVDGEYHGDHTDDIDPEDIASMSVLKGDNAINEYGEEGRNGVIEITTVAKDLSLSGNLTTPPEAPFGDGAYKRVDIMPAFPGCEDFLRESEEFESCSQQKMLEYIYTNVKYPAAAREAGEEGMTVVQFVIDQTGRVAKAKIVRDVGTNGLGDAALAVVDQMRSEITWLPGIEDGKAVAVLYTLPIRFKMQSDDTEKTDEAATDAAGIALRPNPAQGAFTIDLTGIVGEVQIVVTDIAGRKIYEQRHSIAADQTSIEISDSKFARMAAVVSVSSNKTTYSQKIVFE
jgi:TonB family protein